VSCERINEQLADFLEERLSDVERRAVEAHLAGCAACRQLLEALRGTLGMLGAAGLLDASDLEPGSEGLAAAILARTSGSACSRAQSLLCDLVDATLAPADALLVETHLEHCNRCASLRTTLGWLRGELPQMATLEPRVDVVPEILQATRALGARPGARVDAVVAAVRRWWSHLVARPRFAWEAAYVATLILVLLFGTSVSPFRGVPSRAMAAIQIDPRQTVQATSQQLRVLHAGIGNAGSSFWGATGGRAIDGLQGRAAAYADAHPGMTPAWQGLERHSTDLRHSLSARNLAGASLDMRSMSDDLHALWDSFRTPVATEPPAVER
jgi:predicted anti-sigma-YlaC factor YlaD